MSLRSRSALCLVAMITICVAMSCSTCEGGNPKRYCNGCITPHQQAPPDLFYNFYVQAAPDGTSAQLYLSPVPTPRRVGHTYITYQPLMPHELMYCHDRVYYRYNASGGSTRTSVKWW